MRRTITLLLFLPALIGLSLAQATEVHKSQNADGTVEYSDVPESGSKTLQLPPVNSVPATPATPQSDQVQRPTQREDSYNSVQIVSPANDEVIRDNQDTLQIRLRFDPTFHSDYGHRIQVLVDGVVAATFDDPNNIQLTGLYRGSHTIVVRVVDRNGKALITSQPVIVHMKHASILHPKPVQ